MYAVIEWPLLNGSTNEIVTQGYDSVVVTSFIIAGAPSAIKVTVSEYGPKP